MAIPVLLLILGPLIMPSVPRCERLKWKFDSENQDNESDK